MARLRPGCYTVDMGHECASEVNQDHMSRQKHTSTESGHDRSGESVSRMFPSPPPPVSKRDTIELAQSAALVS